jgi:hypothetical protein
MKDKTRTSHNEALIVRSTGYNVCDGLRPTRQVETAARVEINKKLIAKVYHDAEARG